MGAWTAGLVLAPAPLAAQSTPAATTNAPATESVGPKELQNFSLSGTVTRPADQPVAAPTSRGSAERRTTTRPADARSEPPASALRQTAELSRPPKQVASIDSKAASGRSIPQLPPQTPASSSVTALSPISSPSAAASAVSPNFAPQPESSGTLATEHGFALLPWLLAAVALGAGAAFLFWRKRSREAFAGGPQFDAFSAPDPAPPPTPSPPKAQQPAPAATPREPQPPPEPSRPRTSSAVPGGVVSTGLRPWLEITIQPLRCIVEETRITFEFEIDLFNSGSAPARAVLVEASVFNAGPTQDEDIGAFFARPVSEGERIAAVPPLQRMTLRSQVVAPRENVQVLAIAERQVFVPLLAFNALYRWSGGEGQTSASYLLGRDTKGAKLAPFRLDLGPRVFRGVGARLLPAGVRN